MVVGIIIRDEPPIVLERGPPGNVRQPHVVIFSPIPADTALCDGGDPHFGPLPASVNHNTRILVGVGSPQSECKQDPGDIA